MRSIHPSMDSRRPSLSAPLYLRVFPLYLRVFGFIGPIAQPPSEIIPEAQFPVRPLPEPQTPDNRVFSSIWDDPSALGPIQPTASSSAVAVSFPSTPPTSSSLLPSFPSDMQYYSIPTSAPDVRDSDFTPTSSSRTQDGKGKKVHRPPNAFMSFRSWLIRSGRLPPELVKCQQSVSKVAGKAWKLLDERSKGMWREMASQLLEDHKKNHPSHELESSSKNCQAVYEKIKKVAKVSDHDTARRLRALANVYATDHRRATNMATPRRLRHERASSHRSSTTPRNPPKPAREPETPQLAVDPQLGPPSTSPSSTSTSSSSTRSFSPVTPQAQRNAFTQGMARQPLPYVFLPQGPPDHSRKAYQLEDGVYPFAISRVESSWADSVSPDGHLLEPLRSS